MGLEIFEEFRPVTPIQAISETRRFNHGAGLYDLDETKELDNVECHTPKSPAHTFKSVPLVCPPAPKKPRPAKIKLSPPAQGYFKVPHDLASVFISLNNPSKKIRAS